MEIWIEKKDCSYCGACGSVCPQACINYLQDVDGFFYPEIDNKKCNNCGQCERVCSSLHPYARQAPLEAYACKHKQPEIRGASSSGGAFYALASYVIEKGGVVFGAAMDGQNRCVHAMAADKEGLRPLMGSKYVQSYLGNIFLEVRKHLDKNIVVLFTGTPCQVSGLKHFLRREYENLYCADIICHGVASPGVLDAYKQSVEKRYGIDVKEIRFRHKNKHWNLVDSMIIRDSRDRVIQTRGDKYLSGFMGSYFLRPSCGACKANGYRSGADLTIGDYWGGMLKLKEFDDSCGVSALIIRSAKGRELFEKASSNLDYMPTKISYIMEFNHNLEESTKHNPGRDAFFKDYRNNKDFDRLAAKHIKPHLAGVAKKFLGVKTVFWLAHIYKGRGGSGETGN